MIGHGHGWHGESSLPRFVYRISNVHCRVFGSSRVSHGAVRILFGARSQFALWSADSFSHRIAGRVDCVSKGKFKLTHRTYLAATALRRLRLPEAARWVEV